MGAETTLLLHVGLRKSGTTYLQHGLRASISELAHQGLTLQFRNRDELITQLVAPLRRFAASGSDDDQAQARAAVRALATRLQGVGGRHLVSLEDLAELPAPTVALLLEELQDLELHVVITARHWGLTIPSEWQQDVKERGTRGYADFVAAVRDRRRGAQNFLARQDVPEIVRRWSVGLEPGRVHVIAVPPSSRTTGTLLELFCGVVGLDPATLRMPEAGINASLSLAQAEMLRRVNVELGERMPKAGGVYKDGVRAWLSRGSLMRHERAAIRLPADAVVWCVEETRRQRDELLTLGADVIGDPDDLLADPAAPSGPAAPSEEEVAAVAISTVADLTDLHWRELDRGAARRAPGKGGKSGKADQAGRSASVAPPNGRVRSLLGRVRARLRG